MNSFSRFVTKQFRFVLAVWAVLFITMVYFAIQLPGQLKGDGFHMDAEHAEVMEELSETFDLPAETMFLVLEGQSNEKIEDILHIVEPYTSGIQSPLEDESLKKNDLAYAILQFDEETEEMGKVVESIREEIESYEGVTLTGSAAFAEDINVASQQDLASAEAIGIPIAIIVLLFAFGSIVASFVPLIIGITTVVTSFGILTLMSGEINLSIFILNIIPMLGLALSIDFALLFINRYREEMTKSPIDEAIQTTIKTAGRSILFSAFCVFIGLGAMMIIKVELFQNIAIGGMIVVSLAVITSLTLLPAIIRMLGDRINKWTIIKVKSGEGRWRKFAGFVMKHPVLLAILAFALLAVGMIPAKDMDLAVPNIDSLPESHETRATYEKIENAFGFRDTAQVYLIAEHADGWSEESGLKEMKELEEQLLKDPLVKEVSSIFLQSGIGSVEEWEQMMSVPQGKAKLQPLLDAFVKEEKLLLPVTLEADGASEEAQEWAREWSDKELSAVDVKIGGMPKFNQEIFDEIFNKLWICLTIILVTTFIILMIAFRSVVIPLKAIVMNIMGLSAAFGVLVYIFQYGHFGLEAGTIALIIPVLIFSLVFGLSMDYEVFLISRIQEEYTKDYDNDRATVEGLSATSKIITSAALIMIVITGAFAFTDVRPVKQIGVGIAIAVAIDATIIRLVLVPSLMKLFGKWNWWLPFRKGPYKGGNWH